MKSRKLKIFFRSMAATFVVIFCLSIIYFGIYFCYEQMSQTCFSDNRSAVIVSNGYIKFFGFEFFF